MPESTDGAGLPRRGHPARPIGCLVHGVTYRNVAHCSGRSSPPSTCSAAAGRGAGSGAGWYEAEHRGLRLAVPAGARAVRPAGGRAAAAAAALGAGRAVVRGRRAPGARRRCATRGRCARACRSSSAVPGNGARCGWSPGTPTRATCSAAPDVVRRKVEVLRRHCADVGRDPAAVEVTHLSTVLVARDAEELAGELARRRPAAASPGGRPGRTPVRSRTTCCGPVPCRPPASTT